MSPSGTKLKQNVFSAYGMPMHLKTALDEWIDSVEDRLSAASEPAEEPAPLPVEAVDEDVASLTSDESTAA